MFNIFQKQFTCTRTIIINSTIILFFGILALVSHLYKEQLDVFKVMLIIIALLLYLIGSVLKLQGINEFQQLKGVFTGKLIFEKEKIIVNDQIILLNEIQFITIEAFDCKGNGYFKYYLDFDYENSLCQGINNFLKIRLLNGENLKIQFQRKKESDFIAIQEIITHYYIHGKIEYLNCVDLLSLNCKSQWEEFKKLKTT